ncbi:MAG: hypothetical protein Q9217_001702 [Psora testacea]
MASPTETPIQIHIPAPLHRHAIPLNSFLQAHPQYTNLAVGAFIFHPPTSSSLLSLPTEDSTPVPPTPRLLLVQRAASEHAFPNLWEVPGGSSDEWDPTILHSAARETFEETGLKLTRFVREIGKGVEFGSRKRRWAKLSFEIEVQELLGCQRSHGHAIGYGDGVNVVQGSCGEAEDAGGALPELRDVLVRTDPKEHQDHKWASLEEVEAMVNQIVTREQFDVMMQAFALKKADLVMQAGAGRNEK